MIAKISRGSDTAGLLRYLLGPGRANEHTDPHLIASWDADHTALEPAVINGRPQVSELADLLDRPLDALPRRPASTVWHCSLRNAPGDRRLSDQEWTQAARHVLDRVGLVPAADGEACRWIAARHGEDHIHLLVTLARQDGAPARTSNDYRRAGLACQELEQRFDLMRTRDRDSTAVQRPTRAEAEKARLGGKEETTRDTLRREVRIASMAAFTPVTFLDELQRSGLLVKTRHSTQDPRQLTGYAVAWPGDHALDGKPVWFSGSTLAPDLSLPRLQERWDGVREEVGRLQTAHDGGPQRTTGWEPVLRALGRTAAFPGAPGEAAHLAHAVASALTAVSRALEGYRGGPSTRASTSLMSGLDRAAARSRSDSAGQRQLFAIAHVALQARWSTRPGAANLVHVERVLLDLLRVIARVPVSGPRSRYQVVVDGIPARLEGPAPGEKLRAASTGPVRDAGPGRSGATSTGAQPAGAQRTGTRRPR